MVSHAGGVPAAAPAHTPQGEPIIAGTRAGGAFKRHVTANTSEQRAFPIRKVPTRVCGTNRLPALTVA